MFIRSDLGVDPWDVFHLGWDTAGDEHWDGDHFDRRCGAAAVDPPAPDAGLGTISNVICIGLAADASMALIPELSSLPVRIAFLVSGIVMNAIAPVCTLVPVSGQARAMV
jgi:uncharacterized membrane protein YczE